MHHQSPSAPRHAPRHARRPERPSEGSSERSGARHRRGRWWHKPAALLAVVAAAAGAVQLGHGEAAEAATSQVTLTGHGFGHGRGLSQWGSYGYAVDKGWDSGRILDHYYGGTKPGTVGDDEISVRLMGVDGAQTIMLTSGADFYVNDLFIGAGSGARFTRQNGTWILTTTLGGCKGTDSFGPWDMGANPAVWLANDAGEDRSKMFTVCNNGLQYRGNFRPAIDSTGGTHLVNFVRLEQYLRGVVPAESPAAWGDAGGGAGMAALEAQAVAARSYSRAENRYSYAQTCDTTACQVYGGVAREDRRTDTAIRNTAGVVRRDSKGGVVRTEFSASTGGWTAGGAFPAVEDLGDSRSPHHDWKVVVDGPAISRAWPQIGAFSSMQVTARNGLGDDGGRATKVVVTGSSGSVTTTGNDVRSKLGLKSDWFSVITPSSQSWMLRGSTDGGEPAITARFGGPKDTTLACDFAGDGRDGLTSYRNGVWTMRESASTPDPNAVTPADATISYGAGWMLPVCGDWDGDGKDGVGVYDTRTGTWYLRNSFSAGDAEIKVQYGWSAALPVVGDWDGDGKDSLGVYAGGTWMVRNSTTPGRPDTTVQYGWQGATPVSGDWDGAGRSGIGVFSGGRWLLRDTVSPGDPDRAFDYGVPGDAPVVGRWTAGSDGAGITRPTA
ncbi:SpoIID/LytB domain-containing protein [Quadrisphaera granulorum]|uniref:SpoIID/LytB domain-containing protein n=1 Tax=Quadrisphaera granulorum TaxID=317664 RepID=UPI000D6A99A9|nr:SpoIID/LytB domain-containing protein [Quadrisphaera granulorum]